MPVFQYTARTLKGDLVNDKIDLPTRDDVIAHLRKNRMVVVQVRAAPREFKLSFKFGGGVKTRDVVVFTRQFATMINAGLPLVQALSILAQQTENKVLADVTRQVVYDVESGQTLADALRKHPTAFSDLYVNMVAAGEAGGILDTILIRLAEFLEKNDAIVRKVKGAMIYPRSEEHTSELQSRRDLVCRLLLEKKKKIESNDTTYFIICIIFSCSPSR